MTISFDSPTEFMQLVEALSARRAASAAPAMAMAAAAPPLAATADFGSFGSSVLDSPVPPTRTRSTAVDGRDDGLAAMLNAAFGSCDGE